MTRALAAALMLAACVPAGAPPQPSAPRLAPPRPTPTPTPAPPIAPEPILLDGAASQGALLAGRAPAGTATLRLDGTPVALAPDNRFVIGFDRDAAASATLAATLRDGRLVTLAIPVAPRAWRIERLNSLPRFSQPSAEFAARRPAELARIVAARANDTGAAGWRQQFRWPASGRLSGLFGAQRIYKGGEKGSFHSGADVAAPVGAPVVAPADGVVVLAATEPFTLEGNLLIVDHGAGLNSAFLHLSRIDVTEGQRVTQGQRIGAVGRTGRATGPHLHWSLKWQDARLDPLLVAGPLPPAS